MRFVDPRATPATPADPYELEATLDGPCSIALLANGFPDSVEFLGHVRAAIEELLPSVSFRLFDKGDASRPADDDMLDEAAGADAAIAAYGH